MPPATACLRRRPTAPAREASRRPPGGAPAQIRAPLCESSGRRGTKAFAESEDDYWMRLLSSPPRRAGVLSSPTRSWGRSSSGTASSSGLVITNGSAVPTPKSIALDAAGDAARGATLYVTLEPCCHFGKTPPCTDAIIAAGIARVVAAIRDPFPQVGGTRTVAALKAAGISHRIGLPWPSTRAAQTPPTSNG